MAVSYGFFNSLNGDRTYNADQMSEYFKGLISDGVYESVGDGLQVLTGSGMMVQVQTGRAIIDCKWLDNDAVVDIALNPSHVTLNRYTAIVARLDYTNRVMEIAAKDGANATSPTQPTMANTETLKELCLAMVYVKAGATSITQGNITDMRASSLCGWVTGLIEQVDTSRLFLQWQTAYQEAITDMENWQTLMKTEFESWMETLTSQLNVNTYIQQFRKVEEMNDSGAILLDWAGYNYEPGDIFIVTINGLMANENMDYIIDSQATPAGIRFRFSDADAELVEIRVLKSKVGLSTQ